MRKIVTLSSLFFLVIFSSMSYSQTFARIQTGVFADDEGCSLGSSWGDFNNDGYEDLIIVNGSSQSQERIFLYKNNRDGTFSRIEENSIDNYRGSTFGASWGDCDGDGDLDLYVSTYEFSKQKPNLFFLNNGNGNFLIITENNESVEKFSSSGNCWLDFDNDGDLDLFVIPWAHLPNRLYINDSFGNFQKYDDVGLMEIYNWSLVCACSDYDNDDDLDIFTGNIFASNKLIMNNGNGRFSALINSTILTEKQFTLSASWGDYNNDGFSDLIVTNIYAEDYSSYGNNFLYHNNGDGTFDIIDAGEMTTEQAYSSGSSWGDFDNDGDLDLIITNNTVTINAQNSYFRNESNGAFTKISTNSFTEDPGYSCSICDVDNDGDLDIFVANLIPFALSWEPRLPKKNILYLNDGNSNNWFSIKCIGTISNSTAIGAKVRAKAIINGKPVWQMREVAQQTGLGSNNSLRIHFGLGNAELIDTLKIHWPSGTKQVLTNISVNQFLTIEEPVLKSHDIRTMFSTEKSTTNPIFAYFSPWIILRNIGSATEAGVPINCWIENNEATIYSDTQSIEIFKSLETKRTNFKDMIFSKPGEYSLIYSSALSADEDLSNDSLKVTIRASNLIDDFENGIRNWHTNSTWGTVGQFFKSGRFSLNSNPNSRYENNADIWIEFNSSFDLSKITAAHISFWTNYLLEQEKDFGYVEVSVDSGKNWNQIGDAYTGINVTLKKVGHDLSDYCGEGFENIRVRFRILSDSTTNFPGWFIDDVHIYEGEYVSDVNQRSNELLPDRYKLMENYPNPFNAQTIIKYNVPDAGYVKLKICNILGQEIIVLIDKYQQTGKYKVSWNACDKFNEPVPSGLYFYQLEINGFADCKKMLLLR